MSNRISENVFFFGLAEIAQALGSQCYHASAIFKNIMATADVSPRHSGPKRNNSRNELDDEHLLEDAGAFVSKELAGKGVTGKGNQGKAKKTKRRNKGKANTGKGNKGKGNTGQGKGKKVQEDKDDISKSKGKGKKVQEEKDDSSKGKGQKLQKEKDDCKGKGNGKKADKDKDRNM